MKVKYKLKVMNLERYEEVEATTSLVGCGYLIEARIGKVSKTLIRLHNSQQIKDLMEAIIVKWEFGERWFDVDQWLEEHEAEYKECEPKQETEEEPEDLGPFLR